MKAFRSLLALLFAAGLSVAQAQTVNSPITLNNPPSLSGVGGAPSDAHYYTNQAETGLSAETVPSANAQTLLGHTFVQMLADIAAQAADVDLTTWAGITPATGVGAFLATPSSANLNAALTDDVPTLAGANNFTANGALSAPGAYWNGTWITGGSATTTKPYALVETTGAASAAWSTAGTGLGVNAASGFTGNLIDAQTNGVAEFKVNSAGQVFGAGFLNALGANGAFASTTVTLRSDHLFEWSSTTNAASGTYDLVLRRGAAATLALGAADAAAPVAQNLAVQSVVTGTTDTAGANFTIKASQGTGTGASGSIILATASAGSTGSTPNALSGTVTFSGNGNEVLTGSITTGSASSVTFGSRSRFKSTADGTAMVRNNADSANSDFETKTVRTDCFAIGSLPTGAQGKHACVTDQLTTCAAAGTALTAGGSKVCPVFYDGAAWVGE